MMEGRAGRLAGLTLGEVLGKEKDKQFRVNRTLLDIIREEEPNCRVYRNLIDHQENKKGWKSFKDRLRPKRGRNGDAWAARVLVSDVPFHRDLVSSSNAMGTDGVRERNQLPALAQLLRDRSVRVGEQVQEEELSGEAPWVRTDQEDLLHMEHVPVSDVPIVNGMSSMLTRNSLQIPSSGQSDEPVLSVRLYEALAAEREQMQMVVSSTEAATQDEAEVTEINVDEVSNEIGREAANEQQQVRMSLMDLLEETDRLIRWSSYAGDVDSNDDEGYDHVEEEGSNLVEQNCCICMVRHKGSAFIPCGHTFCRLCSRELWVNRGNCPICNGFILEILDIF